MSPKSVSKRCGRIALIGLPNAGKSTLTNLFVGAKVSIVSHKVQTTRIRTLGIAIKDDTQLVLLDTPGIFEPKKTLEKALVKGAWRTVQEADIVLVIIDSTKSTTRDALDLITKIPSKTPVLVAFNKIDTLQTEGSKAPETDGFYDNPRIEKIFMISALKGIGTNDLMNYLCSKMPLADFQYPEDILTDQPERFWAAEITREQLFLQLHDELPYETYVEPEGYETFQDGSLKISQAVVVSRASQKGIILGKGGARIKSIGQISRKILEEELGCRVHLKLFVKIQENWMDKAMVQKELGLI